MKKSKSLGKMPSPPDYLFDRNAASKPQPMAHVPKNSTVEYSEYQDTLNKRRLAETDFANLYSDYQNLTEFNQQLLRKLRLYQRYQERIRRGFDSLTQSDGSRFQTSIMLQKDLYIAERSVETLQIENNSFMATVLNHEEKEKILKEKAEGITADLEHLKMQFQLAAEKLDEKNLLLQKAEEKLQDGLFRLEQMSGSVADAHKKQAQAQEDINYLKQQLNAAQLREDNLAALNNDLAEAMTKLQKRNRDLEQIQGQERQQFDLTLMNLRHQLKQQESDGEITGLIKRVLPDSEFPEPLEISQIVNLTPNTGNLDRFYKRWSHIINELSTHSVPIKDPLAANQVSQANDCEHLLSEHGELEF